MTAKVSKVYRQDSYQKALQEASRHLVEAQEERAEALATLHALDAVIPALQRTVAALTQQLNPECSSPVERLPSAILSGMRADNREGVGGSIPSLGANLPENLRGMGAIRNGETIEVTEEQLLPEPEGNPLVPEE